MDWKIFFTSFWMIFLTEMGDKTQLANLSLSAESKAPVTVFCGSVLAYSIITLLAVFVGGFLTKIISPVHIKLFSGGLFVAIGILILIGKL